MPAPVCPLCGESVQRIPRHVVDRLLSVVYPVRRYRCKRFRCGWEGTLSYRADAKDTTSTRSHRR